ncbi:MAG: beta-ketoacyl-ACP synthase III [Bacteroidetes bacterium]|nr:beta-ketoacyl-ACP synthase III [Bacteroidota bacterium]
MRPVYITRLSKFLPNEPVANDQMEHVLGMIDGKPSKARAIVLRKNGIKTRYYALRDGKSTHTNVELCANAIRGLFDDKITINDIDILAVGTSSPEQVIPSHGSMVHGAIGGAKRMELMSAMGTCCSSMQALKYAYMAISGGFAENAVGCGSEKMSTWMHASRFQHEADNHHKMEEDGYIAFQKEFLRWMLSDGAAAALVQAKPNENGLSLKIEWLETTSFANELETCMYAGAEKNADGGLTGWNDMPVEEWENESVFSVKQDTRLLGDNIVPKGGVFIAELMKKHNLTSDMVDYYLPHMSSEFFKQQIQEYHQKVGLDIPFEKWFYNLPKIGNVGSASAYMMLEEMMNNNMLKKGDRLLVMVPESARFSYAYMYLTVV